jgi:hypothetical protein
MLCVGLFFAVDSLALRDIRCSQRTEASHPHC